MKKKKLSRLLLFYFYFIFLFFFGTFCLPTMNYSLETPSWPNEPLSARRLSLKSNTHNISVYTGRFKRDKTLLFLSLSVCVCVCVCVLVVLCY